MTQDEIFVRNSYKNKILFFSDHAYDKIRRLKISESEVINCIEKGYLIETQPGYQKEDPRMLFYNGHTNSFYVVVTVTSIDSVIITVCETDLTIWDKVGDTIKRKQRVQIFE